MSPSPTDENFPTRAQGSGEAETLDHLRYWKEGERVQNIGDFLTAYFEEKLFLRTARRPMDVRVIGSYLHDWFVEAPNGDGELAPTLTAWGGGIRELGGLSENSRQFVDILSVRGPVSASELGLGASIPMGDPALLLPGLYEPRELPMFAGKSICIPHFHDSRSDTELLSLSGCDCVLRPQVANRMSAVEEFIDFLVSADFVLSASLHGAIIAAAYGRPFAFWDNEHLDLPLKWSDFAGSVGIPTKFLKNIDLAKVHYAERIKPAIKFPPLWGLLAASPYLLRPVALFKILQHELKRRERAGEKLDLDEIIYWFDRNDSRFAEIATESRTLVTALARDYRSAIAAPTPEIELTPAAPVEPVPSVAVDTIPTAQTELRAAEASGPSEVPTTATATVAIPERTADCRVENMRKSNSRPWRLVRRTIIYRLLLMILWFRPVLPNRMAYRFSKSANKRAAWLERSRRFEAIVEHAEANSSVEGTRDLWNAFLTLHGDAAIYFPPVTAPEVSVIIPAYRGLADLEACLRSLSANRRTEPSFEVIVVDDCPSEPVLWALPYSGGLIGVSNEENLGFLRTCRRGVEKARGRVLCFLNSDTIVSADWLGSLVEAVDSSSQVGLSGGMLLNRDGTIQDAGWRIMQNGWGHPLGRGANARDGLYTYRRPVDCVTGACFVMTRQVWDRLDGFDLNYAPAFYEEFDLAFRAKEAGLQVLYEPRSRVIHLGSASYGSEQRDQLSRRNQAFFWRRFEAILHKQPNDCLDNFALLEAGPTKPVILVVDYGVPEPDRHAGDVTMTNYLRLLADAGWRVVYGPRNGLAAGPAAEALESYGIQLIRRPQTIEVWLKLYGNHVKQVWLCRPEIAERLIESVRNSTQAPIAYYTHDLHHLRMQREAELRGSASLAKKAEAMRVQESAVLAAVDRIMAPSEDEAQVIRNLVPASRTMVLPPYHYESGEIIVRNAEHFASRSDILFIGGFPHIPNVDAALFIVNEVMPLVWKDCPEARVLLIGYAPPPEVRALAGPNVVVTGQVPVLEPWFEGARVMLAALRYGAGVKGKVVEAMRYGVPVVGTTVAAEGIPIVAGRDALITDDASGLAREVVTLLKDAERCADLSRSGAALIAEHYSRAAARRALDTAFPTLRCSVCGSVHRRDNPPQGNLRETFVCLDCFALSRTEALAKVLVRRTAKDGETNLLELLLRRRDLRIHELGFVGGIAETIRGFQNYSSSDFFPDVELGALAECGVRCEDVTRLTYPDTSFDLMISQDVFEHVNDPQKGFDEVARVLRPGGAHYFTVPQNRGEATSVTRARIGESGVEYILPAEYHGDPIRSQGALVFTDFGLDLADMVRRSGLEYYEYSEPTLVGSEEIKVWVYEARKPSGSTD